MYTMYMALHITNAEVEREVRDLALQRRQTITELIGTAVRHLKYRGQQSSKPHMTAEEVMAFVRSFPKGPVDYSQTEDEILGYGPNGY